MVEKKIPGRIDGVNGEKVDWKLMILNNNKFEQLVQEEIWEKLIFPPIFGPPKNLPVN